MLLLYTPKKSYEKWKLTTFLKNIKIKNRSYYMIIQYCIFFSVVCFLDNGLVIVDIIIVTIVLTHRQR